MLISGDVSALPDCNRVIIIEWKLAIVRQSITSTHRHLNLIGSDLIKHPIEEKQSNIFMCSEIDPSYLRAVAFFYI